MSSGQYVYWDLDPDAGPNEIAAQHDGGVGLDRVGTMGDSDLRASGPGNYTVAVRQQGKMLDGDDRIPDSRTIELSSYVQLAPGQPFRFNRGMARWFGMRLIEAAELDEVLGREGGPQQSQAEVDRLGDWMRNNAADWIGDGSAVDNAIALLAQAKQILAETPESETASIKRKTAMADRYLVLDKLRASARKLIDEQSAPAALELGRARRDAISAGYITEDEFRREVIEHFTPNQQTIIRGRIGT